MSRLTRYDDRVPPGEGEPSAYRTPAPREPELVTSSPLGSGPPPPLRVTWKQIAIFLLIVPFAMAAMVSMLALSQGGSLLCDRGSNRCDLDNGWLIHDRERFPVEHLQGAHVVWSHGSSMWTGHKIYGVEIVTLDGAHALGGESSDRAAKVALKNDIEAYVKDPSVATLDVRVAADTFPYVIVAMLGVIYGIYGLALLVGWLRQRKQPA